MLHIITSIAKDRRRHRTQAPRILQSPEVIGGVVTPGSYGNYGELWTLVGATLTAFPGEWDQVDGATAVVGYWVDVITGEQKAPDNQVTYVVVPEDEGSACLSFRSIGTRGGVSVTVDSFVYVLPNAPWAAIPYTANGQSFAITGSLAPGATLTRPTITWLDPYDGVPAPMVIVGTWWKNGVATSSHGATYNATVDGDVIHYEEVATNASGSATSYHPSRLISQFLENFRNENLAQYVALTTGKPGGAASMNVFSTTEPQSNFYIRNTACWAAPLMPQLTGRVMGTAHNGQWSGQYGGIPITPRHFLYCNHAHPHAENTWIAPSGPCHLRFVKGDNSLVDVIQILQSTQPSLFDGNRRRTHSELAAEKVARPWTVTPNLTTEDGDKFAFQYLDLCIGVVDVDITTLGLPVVPVMARRLGDEDILGAAVTFTISQDGRWCPPPYNQCPQPVGDYPRPNLPMAWIGVPTDHYPAQPGDSALTPYKYRTWDSDSGTASFFRHRGVTYLDTIILSAGYTPNGMPVGGIEPWAAGLISTIDWINYVIGQVDLAAVAMGRMGSVTGLTVTPVSPAN